MNESESKGLGWAAGMVDGQRSKGPIRGYQDLEVFNAAYQSMLLVHNNIIVKLPSYEYALADQLRRSSKAVPRLIAEGHSKRHQVKGFQKYIDDAMAEANETNVSLCQVRDLLGKHIDLEVCARLIRSYDIISRQLYNLALAWQKFSGKRKKQEG